MIIEGLLTTVDAAGRLNVAPMGPIVHADFQQLTLRPYRGTTSFRNLMDTRQGVFHVVDSIGVMAAAAIGRLTELPATVPAQHVTGRVLDDCCRWFEFRITDVDTTHERSEMAADVVHTGTRRPFGGFNRARHAVIEMAILATRLHLLPQDDVEVALKFLTPAVEKTGSAEEIAAFEMLRQHVRRFYAQEQSA
ncbi:MAG: DUF447 family protein [Planctomycetaceae bacterium]